ncbi:ATP-binding protein [Myxococcus sp. K15C18031901]|uniref:sensor histidine kinase n=1 Tax=Myxococcus dinghuensis TaxID=2906761 RepID=UPI0020A7DD9B|nr:ATP-binding protein [Myxococcus dinghuensis]MCP3101005.1 ATP-binding protein [Myxococcus dinghuensis]
MPLFSAVTGPGGAVIEPHLGLKRRGFIVSAGVILLSVLTQPLMFGRFVPEVLFIHVGWSALLVGIALVMRPWKLSIQRVSTLSGVFSLAALALDIFFTGGLSSPLFPLLLAMPLIVGVFTPGDLVTVWAMVLLTLVGVVGAAWWADGEPHEMTGQVTVFLFMAWVAIFGGKLYRRMRIAERQAERERTAALERLARSERLRAEAERSYSETERLALMGRLAAGVAHEVNNPLAYVKSNLHFLTDALRDPAPDLEELQRVLDETGQGVLRIQQIVTDLKRFSRETTDTDEACSLEDALGEAERLASVRLRSLCRVVREVALDVPRVRLSQRHLVQVVVNLLLNAADALDAAQFQPQAGRHPCVVVLRARREEGGVVLEVEDNGPGIPDAVLPRMFDPFFTTKSAGKGTGLGLALCREYLARVGGSLAAENRPGGGARFVLRLPAASPS